MVGHRLETTERQMTIELDAGATDLVAIERTLETREDVLVATVSVRSLADAPLVVRFSDAVGSWSGADSVRVHPETEPERWTVDDAALVAELLVDPDEPATVTYDLQGSDAGVDPDPVVVERTQPIDPESLDAGRIPRFRDTHAFEGQGADAQLPTAGGEATDADVRQAVEAIAELRSKSAQDEYPDKQLDPLDLADPEES